MPIRYVNNQLGSCGPTCGGVCPDVFGCPPGVCPDFIIRRNDTKPAFRVCVDDCREPLDLRGRVLEVNMWAKARLKAAVLAIDTDLSFADAVGFYQVGVGDVLHVDHVRAPERMRVDGFDEDARTVHVTRGYGGTLASAWKRGTTVRIFRVLNAPAAVEVSYADTPQVDGTVLEHQLTESVLVYDWQEGDTAFPGCFWLEFKLLKMTEKTYFLPGGHWTGEVYEDGNRHFFTGTGVSDSTVNLSYDTVTGLYAIPRNSYWSGPTHAWTDGNTYTGTDHDAGSVFLNTGVTPDPSAGYNASGLSSLSWTGGGLGSGVEWVRRFPTEGEGFLIRIPESPTAEIAVP